MHNAMLSWDQSLLHPGCRQVHSHFSHLCQRRTAKIHMGFTKGCAAHTGQRWLLFSLFMLFCRTHSSLKSHLFRATVENPKPLKYRYCKLYFLPSVLFGNLINYFWFRWVCVHMHLYTSIRLKDTRALTHSKYPYKHILLSDNLNPKIISLILFSCNFE